MDQVHRSSEKHFHGLGSQLNRADIELEAVFEDVVPAHLWTAEAVGHIEAQLNSGHLRVWFAPNCCGCFSSAKLPRDRHNTGCRQGRQCDPAELATIQG